MPSELSFPALSSSLPDSVVRNDDGDKDAESKKDVLPKKKKKGDAKKEQPKKKGDAKKEHAKKRAMQRKLMQRKAMQRRNSPRRSERNPKPKSKRK